VIERTLAAVPDGPLESSKDMKTQGIVL